MKASFRTVGGDRIDPNAGNGDAVVVIFGDIGRTNTRLVLHSIRESDWIQRKDVQVMLF